MKTSLALLFTVLLSVSSQAQEDLLDFIQNGQIDSTAVTMPFIGTRIGLGHSVSTRRKGTFETSIEQRYWNTPAPSSNSFIVDRVCTTFAADYAWNDRFTTGVSYSTLFANAAVFAKYRILEQYNHRKYSVGLTFVQTINYKSSPADPVSLREDFSDRLGYVSQLLIAHKFSGKFSAQLSPSFVYRGSNRVDMDDDAQVALGISGRYKLTPHLSLFSEYFYQFNRLQSIETFDAFSIGANWEVSDLMLRFMFTNARPYTEDLFITLNRRAFNVRNENLTFGFKAVYTFQL